MGSLFDEIDESSVLKKDKNLENTSKVSKFVEDKPIGKITEEGLGGDLGKLKQEWKEVSKKVKFYDKKYAYGKPLIADTSYDLLKYRLQEIEEKIGKQKNSPLNKIGHIEDKEVKHKFPMLSLDHGYGTDSMEKFYKKILNSIKLEPEMVLEHKIDGISASLSYTKGKLSLCVTRGDGTYGMDITKQAKYIENIPQEIPVKIEALVEIVESAEEDKNIDINKDTKDESSGAVSVNIMDTEEITMPDEFEIRGEIFMDFESFNKVNNSIEKEFKNPRNATAGILRNKEMDFIANYKLKFIPHGFVQNLRSKYSNQIDLISKLGFNTMKYVICDDLCEAKEAFQKTELSRNDIPYPVDGVVLKVNSLKSWDELGFHSTAPRFCFACKFFPRNSSTTIVDIVMQIGKSGAISPVAILDPIFIDGVEVKKVSLHNVQEVINKDYRIGDEVIIARAGDVIPHVMSKKNTGKEKFILPVICPSCNSELVRESVMLKCINPQCSEQKILQIEHFVSKKALNISNLGEKNIRKLFEIGLVNNQEDVIKKLRELILQNNSQVKNILGSKVAINILNSINSQSRIELNRWIFALCIPNVGYGQSTLLAKNLITLENFIETFTDKEKLANINIKGIGPSVIDSISNYLKENTWVLNSYNYLKNIS
ncbi:NAD-dependent DNA ligase LigA [Candidatus Nesciobacter abundans]|uniref:DNA ligase (NAD(+)) n=1 Tax=Candidatus Nesciobacter abundans TaxID=2601668 RepID=A0A5C0UG99_9PROT|nr:NAD-dependent DNA ligase LigA [Candidatus Nesciobacter abundans]QEK39136.1 NAD-dependent DNA ligase LigA [Candidatus Nesciobacter abundans]